MKLRTLNLGKGKASSLSRLKRRPRVTKGTLLLVDDEPANLHSLQQVMERNQYKTFATTDPGEALSIARSEHLDIIITDQRMPGMLGTELLVRIKEFNDDNVRMILTGYTDVKDLITCINEGLIYRYLVKPWTATELDAVVKQGMVKVTLQRTVRKMIPSQVMDRLYAGGLQDAAPGEGKEMECGILFLDIRGFTTLSEGLDARDAFRFLTSYMSHIAPQVGLYGGFIDKYLGDGMLAIFDREGTYATDAVQCARALVAATQEYNDKHRGPPLPDFRKEGAPRKPVDIGIGISVGNVYLGTVGFRDRLEFTVLGDAVNTAHRIQELTKDYDCHILCHDTIAARSGLPHRSVGTVPVRGREAGVPLSEVLIG